MTVAIQSVSMPILMGAIETCLSFTTGLSITPGNAYIVEWYGDEEPRYKGVNYIYFRPTGFSPFVSDGAGRWGHNYSLTVEVNVCTRFIQDDAGSNRNWSRDASRGHYVLLFQVIDALQDNQLWSSYDTTKNSPLYPTVGATKLTVATCQLLDSEGPIKLDELKDPGWGMTRLNFSIPLNLPLTLPTS